MRRAAPREQNLNETLAAVFSDIEASAIGSSSEDDLKGVLDDYVCLLRQKTKK